MLITRWRSYESSSQGSRQSWAPSTSSGARMYAINASPKRLSRAFTPSSPGTALDIDGVALLESLIDSHAKAGGSVLVTTHHQLTVPDLQTLLLGGRNGVGS